MDDIYFTNDVNFQLDSFYLLLNNLYNTVPIRKINKKTEKSLLNIKEVKIAMNIRDLAFKAYRESTDDTNWKIYCKYRNKVKSVLRKYKSKYWENKFSNCDSKEMWKTINEQRKQSSNCFDSHDPDSFNNYFISSQSAPDNVPPSFESFSQTGFNFQCINDNALLIALNKTKSNALGSDNIPLKFIKIIFPFISKLLLHIFNSIIMTSNFPRCWRTAREVPIKKKGSLTSLENYRPISILPCLSKLFEITIKNQIFDYITSNNLLSPCHFGFRIGSSTSSLLLSLTESIRNNINNKKISTLISLDLSKAFDTVNYSILISKLSAQFNFSSFSCKLLYSYLTDRKQFVGDVNGDY